MVRTHVLGILGLLLIGAAQSAPVPKPRPKVEPVTISINVVEEHGVEVVVVRVGTTTSRISTADVSWGDRLRQCLREARPKVVNQTQLTVNCHSEISAQTFVQTRRIILEMGWGRKSW